MSKRSDAPVILSLSDLPPCAGGGISRRNFCAAAGAGLIALGLPGCDPGAGSLSTGGLDDSSQVEGSTAADLSGHTNTNHDAGATGHDSGTGASDMGSSSSDLAQNSGGTCPSGTVSAGLASAIASGTATLVKASGSNFFICRDANGLYALSAYCTHAGATLQKQSSEFYCSRHGATFDLNGQHPTSPAYSPLEHYAVCVDGSGNVMVDVNSVVSATTRA